MHFNAERIMDKDVMKEGDAITSIAGQILESYDFDSVVVIATKTDRQGTNSYHGVAGNWFAIQGSVSDWLIRAETRTQNDVD